MAAGVEHPLLRPARLALPLAFLAVTAAASGSQALLPVAEGAFGGAPPAVAYPARPFAPEPGPFR